MNEEKINRLSDSLERMNADIFRLYGRVGSLEDNAYRPSWVSIVALLLAGFAIGAVAALIAIVLS